MTLCVTIARSAVSRQKAEHAALAEAGAKLVELRLDWIKGEVDVARLLADRPTPVVVTCRRREDGGRWAGGEEDRLKLLRSAILAGPEFVDLEADIAEKVPRFGKTKRVVSHHDMKGTPGSLELGQIHAKLAAADADVVKLVTLAGGVADNAALIGVQKKAKLPTIAFCMGEWGLPSRVACCRFGAPWTYCAFTADREIAPGLPDHRTMRRVYRAHRVGKSTPLFGVLGDPVEHSLSPHLHNAAFRAAGLDGCYLPVRVPAERFAEGVAALRDCGFSGFSVTIPHKRAALSFAEKPDDAATRIGAANTLWLDEAGGKPAWRAANTDRDAALASIESAVKAGDPDATLTGRRATVLGSGGVARAVVAALTGAGCGVTVTARNEKAMRALVAEFGGTAETWPNRLTHPADIVVNCTPVGMWPKMDECPVPENAIPPQAVVFDTIYNPRRTLLLKWARGRDCRVVSGDEMFVRQAEAQFRLFTGRDAPTGVMRAAFDAATAVAK